MNKTVLFQFSICLILLTILSGQVSAKFKTYEDLKEVIENANKNGVKDFEEEIEKGELTKPVNIKPNSEAEHSTKTTLPSAASP